MHMYYIKITALGRLVSYYIAFSTLLILGSYTQKQIICHIKCLHTILVISFEEAVKKLSSSNIYIYISLTLSTTCKIHNATTFWMTFNLTELATE